jgi:uncharacterized membrane protein YbjE (DUF340 family)
MFTVIGFMLAGLLIGYLLRNQPFVSHIGKLISSAIFILLFLLGVSVGANKEVIRGFTTIGVDALALAIGAVLGSVCAAWLVARYIFKERSTK